MQSLKIDPSGDLVILDGELQLISGSEEMAQSCILTLGTNRGEWVLDPEFGIDFNRITGKGISEDEIRDEVTSGLLQDSRIQTVDAVTVIVDRELRTANIRFIATAKNGDTISMEGVNVIVG